VSKSVQRDIFPLSAFTLLVGTQEWHLWPVKKAGCWSVGVDWSFACLIAPAVITTSIIPTSNKTG